MKISKKQSIRENLTEIFEENKEKLMDIKDIVKFYKQKSPDDVPHECNIRKQVNKLICNQEVDRIVPERYKKPFKYVRRE